MIFQKAWAFSNQNLSSPLILTLYNIHLLIGCYGNLFIHLVHANSSQLKQLPNTNIPHSDNQVSAPFNHTRAAYIPDMLSSEDSKVCSNSNSQKHLLWHC